jgi:hypothetical protein
MSLSRRSVRLGAAAIAATMAVIYIGIGLRLLDVGGSEADRAFLWVFGGLAGGAFLLGTVLLVRFDRRWLWILGAVFQVFVYWAYVDVSKNRNPPFEMWGITLRIIQVPLLVALVYLAARPAPAGRAAIGGGGRAGSVAGGAPDERRLSMGSVSGQVTEKRVRAQRASRSSATTRTEPTIAEEHECAR